jgi:hypothetical protein
VNVSSEQAERCDGFVRWMRNSDWIKNDKSACNRRSVAHGAMSTIIGIGPGCVIYEPQSNFRVADQPSAVVLAGSIVMVVQRIAFS